MARESYRISLFNVEAQTFPFKEEIEETLTRVAASGVYVLGEEVAELEKELAQYLNVEHVITVSSGTDALIIALRACGISADDEVVTTPFSFIANATSILHVGARPVFSDISPVDFNIDPLEIERCISKNTRAIVPVHLYGHPASMDRIIDLARHYDLMIVEDAAQAFGAEYKAKKVGSLGDAAIFSFYPTKILAGFGDGGAIATDDDDIAKKARALRNHGMTDGGRYNDLGYNSRLDEIQAAVLRVKLKYIDDLIDERRTVAQLYREELAELSSCTLPEENADCKHAYSLYTIRAMERESLRVFLGEIGIQTGVYYPTPLYMQDILQDRGLNDRVCSWAELLCKEVISLPIYPGMKEEDIRFVSRNILEWESGR